MCSLFFFLVFLTFATVGIPAAFAYCAAPLATNVVGHIRPSGSSPTADAFARRAATRIGFFILDVAATAPYLIGRRRKSGGKRVASGRVSVQRHVNIRPSFGACQLPCYPSLHLPLSLVAVIVYPFSFPPRHQAGLHGLHQPRLASCDGLPCSFLQRGAFKMRFTACSLTVAVVRLHLLLQLLRRT